MPKLRTNQNRVIKAPNPDVSTGFCVSSYNEYLEQRETQTDVTKENIDSLTASFKKLISTPIHMLNPAIEMGEYFVIPVDEIRAMIDEPNEKPDFIHVCNALRTVVNSENETKIFPVTILVPYKRENKDTDKEIVEICKNDNTTYIEAYPCPPDPRCPKGTSNLKEIIFSKHTDLNSFNSLF